MEITMTITVTAKQAEQIAQLLQDTETAGQAVQQMRGNAVTQQAPPIPQTNTTPAPSVPMQQTATQQFTAPTQPQYGAPAQQYTAPTQSAAPVQTQPTAPTAAPTYTIAQLQTACAPLMDAGKGPQLQQLVQSFGVATLMDIPQSRYGEFANGLRQLGGVL